MFSGTTQECTERDGRTDGRRRRTEATKKKTLTAMPSSSGSSLGLGDKLLATYMVHLTPEIERNLVATKQPHSADLDYVVYIIRDDVSKF